MNTTQLIEQWSMDGAHGELDQGFGSAIDILAVLSARSGELHPSVSLSTDDLLVKPAGEDDWRPLLVA